MSTLTHLGKMFGMSVGWFGGWAKSYVQVGMIIKVLE